MMNKIPDFDSTLARQLDAFLSAPERPEGTMRYCECAGFLFAVTCSPELIPPSEWIPIIFDEEEVGYASMEEAQEVLQGIMALYNHINNQVWEGRAALPTGCEIDDRPLDNLAPDAPLSLWARGFWIGHDWLSEFWDKYTPEALDNELGSLLMVLSFFSSRQLAEAYLEKSTIKDKTLGQMSEAMLELLPNAMEGYAHLGRSIEQVLREHRAAQRTPARSEKIGRNEPCPCGSGKKYKKCCGASVH